jgi:hypothetical protein
MDDLLDLLPLVGVVTFLVVPFATGYVAHWIVGSVDEAAKAHSAPAHFYTVDLLAFVMLFQVAFVIPAWVLRAGAPEAAVPLGVLATAASAAFWVGAIRSLSKAGVRNPYRRAVFIVYVLPVTGFGVMGIVFLLWGCLGNAVQRDPLLSAACGLGAIVILVALAIAQRLTGWVLAERVSKN